MYIYIRIYLKIVSRALLVCSCSAHLFGLCFVSNFVLCVFALFPDGSAWRNPSFKPGCTKG